MRKFTAFAGFAAIVLACCPDAYANRTIFNVPGGENTMPASINSSGSIAGNWYKLICCHGFIRDPDGGITKFDVADAKSTTAVGINDDGAVTGWYQDSIGVRHGYVRAADGTITAIDVQGSTGTEPTSINNSGVVVGYYMDSNKDDHGFIRNADGTITNFDPPGSISDEPASINDAGLVAGIYFTGSNELGYLREADGEITSFSYSNFGTYVYSINNSGVITGIASGERSVGYMRMSDGSVEILDIAKRLGNRAYAGSAYINAQGTITGSWSNKAPRDWQGFIWTSQKQIKKILIKQAERGNGDGTFPTAISANGSITGYFVKYGYNGFVWTP
jgi:hypothetical protein